MQAAIERVQLAFALSRIIDLQVSNNILYIAVGASTVLRIDLDDPSRVHETQLPKSRTPLAIKRLMVDPEGLHLLAETESRELFYLYANSPSFRSVRLPVPISHIAWHQGSIFYTHDSTIYQIDAAALKNNRKVSPKKIWTKEPLHDLAVIKQTIYALSSTNLYSADLDKLSLEFESVERAPPGSRIVANAQWYALVTPDSIKFNGLQIDVAASRVLLSRYHVLVFTQHSLSVYNSVNCTLVTTIDLPPYSGAVNDPKYETFWVFNSTNLFELKLENETEGMWQVYVGQNQFDAALEIASAADKRIIYKEYGDYEFKQENFETAGTYYGSSSAHIEGLALKFIQLNKKTALIRLFQARLLATQSPVQQTILTSWVGELLIQENMNDEFKSFIETCKAKISVPTILEILRSHASDLLVWFADYIQDYEAVVKWYIAKAQWHDALKVLREQEQEALVYRYSEVLLVHAPKATVDSWLRIQKLDPVKLLPALLTYSSTYKGDYSGHQAIRYLKHQLQDKVVATPLYNAMLMIYAQTANEDDLMEFLQSKASKSADHNFGLRVCLENHKVRCAIYLYTVMNLVEEAVMLCLGEGLVDEAIEVVEQRVDNDQVRRMLWIEIARKMIATSGTSAAVKLTDHLNIEDLIQLFPDFDTLGEMVPEVVKALEASSDNLAAINQEMQDSIRASDGMQKEMKSFKKQYALVEAGEACQQCSFPLATRKFYVFPCQHGFHFDCIIGVLERGKQRGKIEALKNSHQDKQELNAALDPIASAECLLCCESRIDTVDVLVCADW